MPTSVHLRGEYQWLLSATSGSVAKGLVILEIAGSGPVHCHFPLPLFFLPCVVHNVNIAFHDVLLVLNYCIYYNVCIASSLIKS